MNIVIVGCNGQLGTDMVRIFRGAGHAVSGIDYPDIDIADPARTTASIAALAPQVVVNAAAYTAVDAAESDAAQAWAVNAHGAGNVAAAASATGAALVHLSTDYVFDGVKKGPYIETDTPNPLSVYGASKLAGERRVQDACPEHFIVRIAWLYGAHGANFVKNILRIAVRKKKEGAPLLVVNDQHGSPTHTVDVCNQLLALLGCTAYGIYHGTSEGSCTWYDFARRIISKYGIDVAIRPCATHDFPRPAPRPANSVLENAALKALGKNTMPDWSEAFDAFYQANREPK